MLNGLSFSYEGNRLYGVRVDVRSYRLSTVQETIGNRT